jgi:hypothetical protein
MRHREAWAVEKHSPTRSEWERQKEQEQAPARSREARAPASKRASAPPFVEKRAEELPRDILVVASKLKDYIRASSGMNTSDAVSALCDEAIRNAAKDGRKTVLDRDLKSIF